MTSHTSRPIGSAQRQFGAVASAYATSAVHASGPDLRAMIDAAHLTGSERILDLGCGAGHVSVSLAPNAASVTAVDVTPEMLAVAAEMAAAKGLTNIVFQQADATSLPFENQSFDLVTSRYSAHHFPDPASTLRHVARVLKPGGRFLLIDTVAPEQAAHDTFFNAAELLRDASHVRNWRVSEWKRLFLEAGLEPSVLFEMGLELDGPSWVTRMQTPLHRIDSVKELFIHASPSARQAFAIQDGDAWGWTIPVALLQGRQSSSP